MNALLPALAAVAIGFAVLAWSADRLVASASSLSHHLGIPPLIVGMVVIGFATSAPEMIVSTVAAWSNGLDLAIGNALGSNIANIGLVLGVTAVIATVPVSRAVLQREMPMLVLITAAGWYLLADGHLSRLDGMVLIGMLALILTVLARLALRSDAVPPEDTAIAEEILLLRQAVVWLIISLIALMLSARLLVWGAVESARLFGVSELVIGLSIVALGTSLPELAASVASALRGKHALALGNIIGSNVFNTLAVIGFPALIHPDAFSSAVLTRDMPLVLGISVLLWALACAPRGLARPSGVLLIGCYLGYQVMLYQ